ncbi:polypeptide N-acetylgalactosaminyltransferase 5-like [Mytilus californianus]|uniref:polypeptide N-acetylgalactosaminyltransferase 5-like n=1 Tax=Mytilus californianus TaxID=6549 RepID=UPI0022458740|nr:polypeptide N-acetylgalactosaminyltransferase 5-like [Mytilus californianus]
MAVGPGELGQAVLVDLSLFSNQERKQYEESQNKHGYNVFVSDLISFHRSLPRDTVYKRCTKSYDNFELPPVSVIIPFRDESWSVLLRTVHSILDRTPSYLLREIILVDDGSKKGELKTKLDIYLSHLYNVRVIRNEESKGLMVARQRGIDQTIEDVIVVMDSHQEVAEVWLEPLLQQLKETPRALVVPVVDGIDMNTFQYKKTELDLKKKPIAFSFDWRLMQTIMPFKREYLLSRENFEVSPIRLPSVQGNVFVANKTIFQELGGMDTGMHVWGGEQIELAIKYITCGDGIFMIPCSHIGHLYRPVPWRAGNTRISNEYRVAEVWLDDYKQFVFEQYGNYTYKAGDVAERKMIRKRNKCKPFTHYLEVAKELIHFYVPENLHARGTIKPVLQNISTVCLDASTMSSVSLLECHYQSGNQYWELSANFEIRHSVFCLAVDSVSHLIIEECDFEHHRKWDYRSDNTIRHRISKLCLTIINKTEVNLQQCVGSVNQQWIWKRLR